MGIVRYSAAVATMSWIDPITGLPEVDSEGDPAQNVSRSVIVGKDAYRFANFLEAYIHVDDHGRIVSHGFSSASEIYSRLFSYAYTFPEILSSKRLSIPSRSFVVFRQIVGSRTEAPESIARRGGLLVPGIGPIVSIVGNAVAHQVSAFPPIWTELELTIASNGFFEGSLLRHSLFPSVSYCVQRINATPYATASSVNAPGFFKGLFYDETDVEPPRDETWTAKCAYNAVPYLEEWKQHGWGPIPKDANEVGSTRGNPWKIEKSVVREQFR